MSLLWNGQWRSRQRARRAHRLLNMLAPKVFGPLAGPRPLPDDLAQRLRGMAMEGFRGEWPVLSLGGLSVALLPGLATPLDDCWAVPGVDHVGKVSYLVLGVGDTPFHSLRDAPAEAVSEARRLRPTLPAEPVHPVLASHLPSHA